MSSLRFVVAGLLLVVSLALLGDRGLAQQARRQPPRPAPAEADVSYGPHASSVLDLWKAKSDKPTPLVVFIHGGGFRGGDKRGVPPPLLTGALAAGMSVASINYRLSNVATFPAPMLDSTRAIQFLRSRAAEWNLDPTKIASTGGSAGAGISMWIAFRDDMAKPDSDDPVERQTTRLSCIGPYNGQCSYDPRFIRKHIGGSDISHSALLAFYGLAREEFDTPKAHKLFEAASAINYLTADDPPVFMFYSAKAAPLPLPADVAEGVCIHHPQFGVVLKQEMDKLGIKCELHLAEEHGEARQKLQATAFGQMVKFFAECFEGQ